MRKWHSLGEDKGEVELVLQWCYDADRDFEAFPEIDESGEDAQRIVRRRLPGAESGGQGQGHRRQGLEDPYVKLKVAGTTLERRTKVKKTTLDPVWKELFILPFIVRAAAG